MSILYMGTSFPLNTKNWLVKAGSQEPRENHAMATCALFAFVVIIKVVLESSLGVMAELGPLCMPSWILAGRLVFGL